MGRGPGGAVDAPAAEAANAGPSASDVWALDARITAREGPPCPRAPGVRRTRIEPWRFGPGS